MQVDTELMIDRLVLSGLVIRRVVPVGRHFWLAKAHAGDYSWRTVHVKAEGDYSGTYRILRGKYPREGELDFTIAPGKINYVGELIVEKVHASTYSSSISIRVRNHAAMALRRLVDEHPQLLDRYELHTGGTSGDAFLESYQSERARIARDAWEQAQESSQ